MASTATRRDRREKQKREQRRRSQQGMGRRNPFIVPAIVVAAVILLVLGARAAGVLEPPSTLDISKIPPATEEIGTLEEDEGRGHIPLGQKATYKTTPPTSGDHWSQPPTAPAPWGIKDAMLPNEVTTHNLEHGGIVIAYNNLSQAEVDQLKNVVRALMNAGYRKMILEPYPPLTDAKIALTAWRWLFKIDTVDQTQIVHFTQKHYSDPGYAPEMNVP